jgi:signal transduction histidine kinase
LVRVEPSGTDLVLSVDDSGPGIGIEDRQRALERFHRGMGHAASGSGLGLSIVQRVVEHHHGSLHLDASPMGGLRVVVKLPRAAADRLPRANDSATA